MPGLHPAPPLAEHHRAQVRRRAEAQVAQLSQADLQFSATLKKLGLKPLSEQQLKDPFRQPSAVFLTTDPEGALAAKCPQVSTMYQSR